MPRTYHLHWWSLQPHWNWNWTDHIVPRTHFLPALWSLIRSSWARDGSIFTEFGPRFRNIPHTPIHSQSRTGPCIGGFCLFSRPKEKRLKLWNILAKYLLALHTLDNSFAISDNQRVSDAKSVIVNILSQFIYTFQYICVCFHDFHLSIVVLCLIHQIWMEHCHINTTWRVTYMLMVQRYGNTAKWLFGLQRKKRGGLDGWKPLRLLWLLV